MPPSPNSGGYHGANIFGPNLAWSHGEDGEPYGLSLITSSAPFNFKTATLNAGWSNPINITVIGKCKGVQKYTKTVIAYMNVPTTFTFDYKGVDTVEFHSFLGGSYTGTGCVHFGINNFTYDQAQAPVANVKANPTALAKSGDLLPLKHGTYVPSDIKCDEATFGDQVRYNGKGFSYTHGSCGIANALKKGNTYNVIEQCDYDESMGGSFKIKSLITVKDNKTFLKKIDGQDTLYRYCHDYESFE